MRGVEEAISQAALTKTLSSRGLLPIELTPGTPKEGRSRQGSRMVPRRADVAEATTTLGALLEAGLPLDRALQITSRTAARRDVGEAFEAVRSRVREGGQLATALEKHPRFFPPIAVGMVRAADRGGHLSEVIGRLAEHLERERELRARISAALAYPLLLSVVGTGALAALLIFVLPRFVELLADAGTRVPRSTRMLLAGANALGKIWPFLAVVLVAAVGSFWRWRASPTGRVQTDAWLLRLPIIGSLRAAHTTAQVARTLSTLLSGGAALLPALGIAAESTADAAISQDLRGVREAVRRGSSFSRSLGQRASFPYVFVRLVEVGEEVGQLDELLARAATLLEADLERRLARAVALIEPALIIIFGAVVGFVALSVLQAIYGINAEGF